MTEGQSLGHVSSRLRAVVLSPAQYLRLALAQLGALWLIVGTGAAVRLTNSGLGCRHWPGCERGHPLPAKNGHAFIEPANAGALAPAGEYRVRVRLREQHRSVRSPRGFELVSPNPAKSTG